MDHKEEECGAIFGLHCALQQMLVNQTLTWDSLVSNPNKIPCLWDLAQQLLLLRTQSQRSRRQSLDRQTRYHRLLKRWLQIKVDDVDIASTDFDKILSLGVQLDIPRLHQRLYDDDDDDVKNEQRFGRCQDKFKSSKKRRRRRRTMTTSSPSSSSSPSLSLSSSSWRHQQQQMQTQENSC